MMAALLLTACDGNDNAATETAPAAVPVAFGAQTAEAYTRAAAGTIATNAALQATDGFGVFGCYTGIHRYADSNVQPNFMYNEHIAYNDDAGLWEYSPVKYWPNGEGDALGGDAAGQLSHYVTFFAYAPYSDNDGSDPEANAAGYCISAFSYQHERTNPWLTYRLMPQEHLDKQVDLLLAVPMFDQVKPSNAATGHVQFTFEHALACAGAEVAVTCTDAMKQRLWDDMAADADVDRQQVVVTDLYIVYELTDHARLSLWHNGAISWEPILSGSWTTTRRVDYADVLATPPAAFDIANGDTRPAAGDAQQWSDDSHGVFYIPVDVGHHTQTATVTLSYEVRHYAHADPDTPVTDLARSVTTTLTLADYPDAYQPGRCLNLTLNIDDE
mgnify:CR=1 FL=1